MDALHCQPVDRTPVWLMRQAGRYLPEYRALRAKNTFRQMVQTPELAEEVTLQPIRRFGFDAAILFSDILVIPEALGQPFEFREGGGIEMAFRLESAEQIAALDVSAIHEKLAFVGKALKRLRNSLGQERALIGFGGSPWTLACYMVDGGSSPDFSRTLAFSREQPIVFGKLMEKLVDATSEYFRLQIESGADCLQIFDSWASICPSSEYELLSLRWIREIIHRLPAGFPVIVFPRGREDHLVSIAQTGARAAGIGHEANLPSLRKSAPANLCLQGNLPPELLETTPDTVRMQTTVLLESLRGTRGHILNLGHGIRPAARIECVEALIETVTNFS